MGIFDRILGKDNNAQPSIPAVNKKKILIAESDAAQKTLYIQTLQQEFEVLAVDDGAKGLNSILTFPPDIFIINLELPIMDGKVMLHSIRAIPAFKTTPVIVISPTADSDTIRQVKTYDNANALILKANATPTEIYNNVKMLTLQQ